MAGFDLLKFFVDRFAKVFILAPKIMSVDRTMRKPERAVMLVIATLVRGLFHRKIPCHRDPARPEERITIRPGHVLKKIFREKLPVDFDPKPIVQLGDLHSLARWRGGSLIG